jgi:hypothetical protein
MVLAEEHFVPSFDVGKLDSEGFRGERNLILQDEHRFQPDRGVSCSERFAEQVGGSLMEPLEHEDEIDVRRGPKPSFSRAAEQGYRKQVVAKRVFRDWTKSSNHREMTSGSRAVGADCGTVGPPS